MKTAFAFSLGAVLLPAFACAQPATPPASVPASVENPLSTTVPSATVVPAETPLSPNVFLSSRGELSLQTLLEDGGLSGVALSPEARERLIRALNERNEMLRRANARLADEMRRAFKVTDAQLAQSVRDEDDRRQLERIRRFQPKRYDAMMRARAKQKK